MNARQMTAVTADLVGSRQAGREDRERIQRGLLAAFDALGEALGQGLARPIRMVAGDAFQALLLRPSAAVDVIQGVQDAVALLAPRQEILFGVGWGPLSTGLLGEESRVEELDGPCFHNARAALDVAQKDRRWAVFRGFGEAPDATLSGLFHLMGALRSGWTAKQTRYAVDVRRLGRRVDVAREHDVSPSVITESLQSSHFDAVRSGEEAARCLLTTFEAEPSA